MSDHIVECRYPIKVEDVSFSYADRPVITDCSFNVSRGHVTMLVGDNGAGKSTMIRLILGELSCDSGTIELFGRDPRLFHDWNRVGYVPQAEASIADGFPATAFEIVRSGLSTTCRFELMEKIFHQQKRRHEDALVMEALESCGVEHLQGSLLSSMSGGQRQRVMLARALAGHPDLLVLDEPTASLDVQASASFFNLVEELCHRRDLAALVVTHDLAQMKCKRARTIHLEEGHAVDVQGAGPLLDEELY